NPEKLKCYEAELDKTTVVVPITQIRDGRTLRTMAEGAKGSGVQELGEISSGAREAFAQVDLRDCQDGWSHFSMADRIRIDHDIDALLRPIFGEHAAVGAGLRPVRLRHKQDPDFELNFPIIYFVLAPSNGFPSKIRVSRKVSLA